MQIDYRDTCAFFEFDNANRTIFNLQKVDCLHFDVSHKKVYVAISGQQLILEGMSYKQGIELQSKWEEIQNPSREKPDWSLSSKVKVSTM